MLIISSPNKEFIEYLYQSFWLLKTEMKIGNMSFGLYSCHKIDTRLPENAPYTLISGTPIIIRIPRIKYKEYGIQPRIDYNYLYWKADHPIELFVLQIENNLIKKYNEYYGHVNDEMETRSPKSPFRSYSILQSLKFKKQISTKIHLKNTEQVVIGTLWEFTFCGLEDRNMIRFALDAGLGERNSMGFGFLNLVQNRY